MPPFKKGETGNPDGRPPLPADIRDLRREALSAFLATGFRLGSLPLPQLSERAADPSTSALELTMISCYQLAIAGSAQHMRLLWDRLFGAQNFQNLDTVLGAMLGAAASRAVTPFESLETDKLLKIFSIMDQPVPTTDDAK